MAKKVKSLIHPALHVLMRTSPTAHLALSLNAGSVGHFTKVPRDGVRPQ